MRNRGFTLIEIVVSITVLMIVTGLFLANYSGFSNSQKVRQATSDVIANLQAVRTLATSGIKPTGCDTLIGYIVNFPSASVYTAQAVCQAGLFGAVTTYSLPTGVVFSPVPSALTFYILGRGASADQTITIVGSGTTMNVAVFTSGVISSGAVSSPTGTLPTPTPTSIPVSPTTTPTPTPTLTPTPTSTPTPTPTPSTTPVPNCDDGCFFSCPNGLECDWFSCRNSSCPSRSNCICP